MSRLLSRRRLVVLTAAGVAAAAVATGVAIANVTPPTLPPLTTPVPAPTPQGKAAPNPPSSPPRPAYVVSPSFAGRALHWTQTRYGFSPGTPDSANGKPVKGEIWVRVGDDGLPVEVHGRYALADGTFYQEIVQNRSTDTVILNPIDAAATKAGCRMQGTSSAESLRSMLPLFVDEGGLARYGFAPVAGATAQAPAALRPPGLAPTAVYAHEAMPRAWEQRCLIQGVTTLERLEVGAGGRIQMAKTVSTDTTGLVLGESSTVYGEIEEYDAAVVPASVFALSQKGKEVCGA